MAISSKDKVRARAKRHQRVRRKINGTADRPRLSVYRSLKQIYAQIIDDQSGKTLAAASSVGVASEEAGADGKLVVARRVGTRLAALAKVANIQKVVFDRGGYIYHGRIKALAESAREGGLVF